MIFKVKLKYSLDFQIFHWGIPIYLHIWNSCHILIFCWLFVLFFPQSKTEKLVFCAGISNRMENFNSGPGGIMCLIYILCPNNYFMGEIKRHYVELEITLCLKRISFLKTKLWTNFVAFLLKAVSCAVCVPKIKEVLNTKWCGLKILYLFKGRERKFTKYLAGSLRTCRHEF